MPNRTVRLIGSSPAIGADGAVYVGGSYDGYLYAVNSDGTLRWRYQIADYVQSSPAIGEDGTIYVGSGDHHLYAINPDGTLKWRCEAEHIVRSSPAIGGDGTIYFGSFDGHLYAIGEGGASPTPVPTTGSGCSARIPSDGRAWATGCAGRRIRWRGCRAEVGIW